MKKQFKFGGIICLVIGGLLMMGSGCVKPLDESANQAGRREEPNGTGRSEVTTYDKGYRWEENGWIYVHIEGEPYDRGFQHGYLVAKELAEIKKSLQYLTYWNTGLEWSYFVDQAKRMFPSKMDNEILDEIKGIAAGAQKAGTDVTWEEILTMNGYEELTDYWWPTEAQKVYDTIPETNKDHCSAFMAIGEVTKDGELVMGHNSWTEFAEGQYQNMIIDIVPTKGHRIFMQSQPGFVHSMADFFEMDSGLVGTETTIGGFDQYAEGESPEFYRIRRAMQDSDDLDDFVGYMKDHNSGGYANTWLVADLNDKEMMRFELGLKFDNVQKKKDGFFVGFNAPQDPRIRNLETTNSGYGDIRRHQGARQVRLQQLMDDYYGKLDVETGQTILADHYDVYLKKENNPSSRTVDGHYELDAREYMSEPGRPIPYQPRGAIDGKVTNGEMGRNLSFSARWGNSSGMPFEAAKFLDEHIQWSYLDGYLLDRPAMPWTDFSAGER